MNTQLLNNTEYTEFKQSVLANQNVTAPGFVSEIEILNLHYVKYRDKTFNISKKAFAQLLNKLELPEKWVKSFGSLMGDDVRDALILEMQRFAKIKPIPVNITVDFQSATIIAITDGANACMPNEAFFDLVEQVLGRKNLTLHRCNVNADGEVIITSLLESFDFNIPGMPEELHNFGLTFTNSPVDGAVITPFAYRSVCSNGMIMGKKSCAAATATLNSFSPEALEVFLKQVDAIAIEDFGPAFFEAKIRKMTNVSASYYDVKYFRDMVKDVAKPAVDKDEKEMLAAVLEEFFPLKDLETQYFRRYNIALSECNIMQKKMVRTEMSIWELCNTLTYLGSHDLATLSIPDAYRVQLTQAAGELFEKTSYTTEAIMPQIF